MARLQRVAFVALHQHLGLTSELIRQGDGEDPSEARRRRRRRRREREEEEQEEEEEEQEEMSLGDQVRRLYHRLHLPKKGSL